jgi:cell division protein FtsB
MCQQCKQLEYVIEELKKEIEDLKAENNRLRLIIKETGGKR